MQNLRLDDTIDMKSKNNPKFSNFNFAYILNGKLLKKMMSEFKFFCLLNSRGNLSS